MRLIVHMGLHKTGTTYLQHICNDNHEALLERGVYYEKQAGYPAHHFTAWDILRGDASGVGAMIADARLTGCHTVILSSEDLEGAIFDRGTAASIEAAALEAGAETIEWHICLRNTGEYFASLYSQLQHHIYADPVAMLCEVLRDGMMMVIDPSPGERATPYWCFCFDHHRYISGFASATEHPVILHDFLDRDPFPGWRMLERIGALGAISKLPNEKGRNSRLNDERVCKGYRDKVLRLAATEAQRDKLLPLIEARVRDNTDSVARYAEIVGEQFAESTAAALREFGTSSAEIPLAHRACA
jgi:hypothetical protein